MLCVCVRACLLVCCHSELVEFCEDVHTWMESDPKNVIAVHCKGGKGMKSCLWYDYVIITSEYYSVVASSTSLKPLTMLNL